MRVLLGFRNAQLGFVMFRHPLAESIQQRGWRVSAGGADIRRILRQHDKIRELHDFLTAKAFEIAVYKCAGYLARAVGAEVHENQRVTIFHCGRGFAFATNHGRFNEFIVFITRVGGFKACHGVWRFILAFRQRQQVVRLLHAVPAVVAIHREITANNRGDAAFADFGKFRREFLKRCFRAARRRITAVQECVQVDFLCAASGGQLNHREDMIFMAVHTARRRQTHDMYGFACGDGFIHGGSQHRVFKESALFDFYIETREILVDDAPGAQVNVTDFRVAHLTVWQAHFKARSID
ncbi:hypothetical protein BN130_2823 [Cronobacter malonaticus 507]|nr:hypothetical protein BN130_2823 [Cronobacter malonaticus 507]